MKIGLVSNTFVYHKRRTSFKSFFKQVFNSGAARIELTHRHKGSLKPVHLLPSLFVISIPVMIIMALLVHKIFILPLIILPAIIFVDAWIKMESFHVAIISTFASLVQTVGYGTGFLSALWMRVVRRKGRLEAFRKNFYN